MERASLCADSEQKFFRRKYACMYSWVIKLCLKSNIKECYVVSGNTKDVVSMKFNQLCQGQLVSSGHTPVQGLFGVTATVVRISQVKIHSYVFLTPSRVWVSLWNALGGWCQKHKLHSVTVSRPGCKNRQQDSPRLLGSQSLQPRTQKNPIQKDVKGFPCRHREVSKETFRGKTGGTSQAMTSVEATLTSVPQSTTGLKEQKAFMWNIPLLPSVLPVTTISKNPTAWAAFVLTTSPWSKEVLLSPLYR